MNCAYWKDVVAQLRDPNKCNWASHVLSTMLPAESGLGETNLGAALKCILAEEIIEGAIYAYRDWSSQPYCDLILAQFDAERILSTFREIESPDPHMKVGVLGALEDKDRGSAMELALMLNNPDESKDVLSAVRYSLRAT
jgi:hypothetical protein